MILLPPNNRREWNPEAVEELRRPTFFEEMGAYAENGLQWITPTHIIREAEIAGAESVDARFVEGESDPLIMATQVDPLSGAHPYYEAMEAAKFGRVENPTISEDEWKSSEYYREGIPYSPRMTKGKAMVLSEVYDNARARDELLSKSPGGFGRGAAGFVAEMLPQVLDPINYIPIFGQANVARSIGARAALSAADAMVNTAVADLFLIPKLQEAGQHVTWRDAVTDIAFAGFIGGAFGAGAGYLSRRRALIEHRANMAAAAAQLIEDGTVEFIPYGGRGSRSGGIVEDIITREDIELRKKSEARRTQLREINVEDVIRGTQKIGDTELLNMFREDLAKSKEYPPHWVSRDVLLNDIYGLSNGKSMIYDVLDSLTTGKPVRNGKNYKEIARAIYRAVGLDDTTKLPEVIIDPRAPEVEQWPVPAERIAELDEAGGRMVDPEDMPVEQQLDQDELAAIAKEVQDPETAAEVADAITEAQAVESRANAWTEAAKCVIETTI